MLNKLNPLFESNLKILILGVHGAGMKAIAQYCCDLGHEVFGYDDLKNNSSIDKRIQVIEHKDNLTFDLTIYSTALPQDHFMMNPVKGGELISRVEFISSLTQFYKTIAITGTHGKTTCCALTHHALEEFKVSHDFLIGGYSLNSQRQGRGQRLDNSQRYLLIELDESLPFGELLDIDVLCILNTHSDHLENFNKSLDLYYQNMKKLAQRAKTLILGPKVIHTLAITKSYNVHLCSEQESLRDTSTLPFQSSSQGVLESMKAVQLIMATVARLSLSYTQKELLLKGFKGVSYRFETLCVDQNFVVIRDYGHLPNEIVNLYQTLSTHYKGYEKIIIFQPHKYSRTALYLKEFVHSLKLYDKIFITPVFPAGEKPCDGVDYKDLIHQLQLLSKDVSFITFDNLSAIRATKNKAVCVFQGAGSIKDRAVLFAQAQRKLSEVIL